MREGKGGVGAAKDSLISQVVAKAAVWRNERVPSEVPVGGADRLHICHGRGWRRVAEMAILRY